MKTRKGPGTAGSPTNAKPRAEWIAERQQNRPRVLRLYATPADLEKKCEEFFAERRREGIQPTWAGLALSLGLADRNTLWEMLAGKREGVSEEWLWPLRRAGAKLEDHHEGRLSQTACIGSIFWLKNRGWADTAPAAAPGTIQITVGLNIGGGSRERPATVESESWCEEGD